MKCLGCAALAVLLATPSLAGAGELRLSIANGRVTLVAQDVTVKQILDEWSRVGQTQIVGAERLISTPVTLELTDVAEGRALESLLRSASGYIAKPRTGTPGASAYDRILIMPASKAPAVSAAPAPFQRPQPQVVMPNIDDDNEPNPILPPGAALPQPPQPFPGQPPMQPGQQPQPTLSRPGQLPPPPPVPGNPYQPVPYQPPTQPGVVRPPTVPGGGGTGPGGDPGGIER
jgi:hypothetical protein